MTTFPYILLYLIIFIGLAAVLLLFIRSRKQPSVPLKKSLPELPEKSGSGDSATSTSSERQSGASTAVTPAAQSSPAGGNASPVSSRTTCQPASSGGSTAILHTSTTPETDSASSPQAVTREADIPTYILEADAGLSNAEYDEFDMTGDDDFRPFSSVCPDEKEKNDARPDVPADQPSALSTEYIEITDEFKKALHAISEGKNIFIEGGAGTGKSTFIREVRRRYRAKYTNENGLVVLAPTGVSALIAEGQTIHSFFRLYPSDEVHCASHEFPCAEYPDLKRARQARGCILPPWLYKSEKARNRKLRCIIIDEISMVRADMFDCLICYLSKFGPYEGEPAGGVQICLVGDMCQLPPVLRQEKEQDFYSWYSDVNVFHAKCFNSLNFINIRFTQNFRQHDETLKSALKNIRKNTLNETILSLLNRQAVEKPHLADKTLTLTSTRALADSINLRRLASLPAKAVTYTATFWHKNQLPPPEVVV